MIQVKQYDKIRLKTGFVGRVMEVFGDNEAFIVDVVDDEGRYSTSDIKRDDIGSVFVETEYPVSA